MAQKSTTSRQSAAANAGTPEAGRAAKSATMIERDGQFRRFYADDLIAARRRYDTQLSFIAKGEEPIAYGAPEEAQAAGSSGTQPVSMGPTAVEVARVHIPNGQLFNMAMQLLDEFVTAEPNRIDYAREAVRGLFEFRLNEAFGHDAADDA